MVRWCCANFQCRGVLPIWIRVGQGPTALSVGAGGVVWTFFVSSIISLFFLPLFGRRPDIVGWLVGCFGVYGPLRQYFSLYRADSQREGERKETTDERKNVQTTPTRTYCKCSRPLPYSPKQAGRPGTGS